MRSPTVVVLGLGQGVGIACARRFAEAKWSVMIVDGDHKNLGRAKDELGELVGYLHEDQTTRLGLKNALSGTLDQYDGVDCVIQIPPISPPGPLSEIKLEPFAAALRASVTSAVLAAQIFAPEMAEELRETGERADKSRYQKSLINILSLSALAGNPGEVEANILQASTLATVKALGLELARDHVRSNAIVAIRPRAEQTEDWLKSRTPLGRSATSDELADAAIYLASPAARFITGQSLVIDGGRSVLNGVYPDTDTAF